MARDDHQSDIERMLRDIEAEVAATRPDTGLAALDARVLAVMREVPRHAFVPEALAFRAYDNGALPVGWGQTISQPFIVALMTALLGPEPSHRILEVGTGCGYQTAILSRLAGEVYSVEIVPELARGAAERLHRLGFDGNIHLREGDGHLGWPEAAPYDGIIVTAAPPMVPPRLVEQLCPGGRLVVPVGPPWSYQTLKRIDKDGEGRIDERDVLGVAFVPMTGGQNEGTG